jgi:hypothetical protein
MPSIDAKKSNLNVIGPLEPLIIITHPVIHSARTTKASLIKIDGQGLNTKEAFHLKIFAVPSYPTQFVCVL